MTREGLKMEMHQCTVTELLILNNRPVEFCFYGWVFLQSR